MPRVLSKQLVSTARVVFDKQKIIQRASRSTVAATNRSEDQSLWVRSLYPDIKPVTDVTISQMILQQISKWPKLTALEDSISGRKYTYGDIYSQSRGLAAALIKSGFKRGDVVGIVLPNIPEFAVVLLGIWEAGLTPSPVNPGYTEDEIKRQLLSSNANCVVTIDDFLGAVKAAKSASPSIKSIVIIGDAREGCHTFSEMVKADTDGVQFATGDNIDTTEELANLPYSSGTTGPPKGVMLTHCNMATNLKQYLHPDAGASKSIDETGQQERLIGLLPFFHAYGMAATLILGLYQGSHTLCLPSFQPVSFTKAIREHKPTVMHLVTPLINFIVNSPDFGKNELSSAHTVVAAAAPIGSNLIERFSEKAGKYIFFQEGYGMTELSPLSHILNPSFKNTKSGSCGTPVQSTICKVVDLETGETVGPNKRGEIWVRGPQVMKGYYKNPEATQNTIEDGWLKTGDIGFYDNDSCFYIVDRLKELIKVKGLQVAPSELESILRNHPEIEDVAVIGVPDAHSGELPRAYIVRKAKSTLSEDEINSYMKPIAASFKQLAGGIEFINAIPKAPSGKILRRELVLEYRKKHGIEV